MKPSAVVVRGTLKEDGTLELADKPLLPPGPVRVIVQPMDPAEESRPGLLEVLDQIRKGQEARGYKPPSAEEIEAEIADLRDDEEYEERWRQIWAQTAQKPPPEEKR
jgi:hypothetical protein